MIQRSRTYSTKANYSPKEWALRQDLSLAYRLASHFNWTDLIYTHISARSLDDSDHFLLNPFGLHFHEVTPSNLVRISYSGEIISPEGYPINPTGYILHSAIHEQLPHAGAVIHLHTLSGMAISALQEGILPLTQHAAIIYDEIAYHDYEGMLLDKNEQARIIDNIGNKKILILRNHGFLTIGKNIQEAFSLMYHLEVVAKTQLAILSMGRPINQIDSTICKKTAGQSTRKDLKDFNLEWEAFKRLLAPDPTLSGFKKINS